MYETPLGVDVFTQNRTLQPLWPSEVVIELVVRQGVGNQPDDLRKGQELKVYRGTIIGVRAGWEELEPLPLVPITARATMVPTSTNPNKANTRFTRRHHWAFCRPFSCRENSDGFALLGGESPSL